MLKFRLDFIETDTRCSRLVGPAIVFTCLENIASDQITTGILLNWQLTNTKTQGDLLTNTTTYDDLLTNTKI